MFHKSCTRWLDLLMVRKRVVSSILIVLILSFIGLSAGCKPITDSNSEDGIFYNNDTLGFSLIIPGAWKDKYIIEEAPDEISIFNKKIYENYGLGRLIIIERAVGELITQEDMQQAPVGQQIILRGNGYTYFTVETSDVQYPPDDAELGREYKAMIEEN